MAVATTSFELSEADVERLALRVFDRVKVLLDPAGNQNFLSEQEMAKWCGLSVQTLRRLRWAGVVVPSRVAPLLGYSADDRDAMTTLMKDPVRWPEAMAAARNARANSEG
ncbi:DNA-binding protein [Bremerella cremea]|uniref:Uncharacterized protein n=1 Tax=Blastopirellula marina TaxID=124 RepID=A0A2S8G0A8_9BACT|nr:MULTISPECIES: DNA-binding protein [Pirellulaceae]PQO37574.1 hypothetical protein C5Y83_06415 [Blastopirellula marina]RCS49961.1 DNA-binding protein [Bremerella cremea]